MAEILELEDLVKLTSNVRKKVLRTVLREQREKVGLTQKQAAERVVWSLSKLVRIETGVVPVSPADVRILLLEYGVPGHLREEAIELAKLARQPDQWTDFAADISTHALRTLIDNESAARAIRSYEVAVIPGLFQTEEYARSLLIKRHPPREVDRKWEIRKRRQELAWRSVDGPDINVIMSEAALSCNVGGHDVMRRQLETLIEFADRIDLRPRLTIQMLPFEAGAPSGWDRAFTIFNYKTTYLNDMAYMETSRGDSIEFQGTKEFEEFDSIYWDLWEAAHRDAGPEHSRGQFINDVHNIISARFPDTAEP